MGTAETPMNYTCGFTGDEDLHMYVSGDTYAIGLTCKNTTLCGWAKVRLASQVPAGHIVYGNGCAGSSGLARDEILIKIAKPSPPDCYCPAQICDLNLGTRNAM